MARKKLTKQQLREKKILEDKKFKKYLKNGMIISFIAVILIYIFYFHWCNTRYFIRKTLLYGKEIPHQLICDGDDQLQYHKASRIVHERKEFYICSSKCQHLIIENFNEAAMVADAFTGDTICKADALIGLKDKGKPEIVYFKNKQNFKNYYETNNK